MKLLVKEETDLQLEEVQFKKNTVEAGLNYLSIKTYFWFPESINMAKDTRPQNVITTTTITITNHFFFTYY